MKAFLLCASISGTIATDRPIIGILTQPLKTSQQQYIASSYIKFVETGGARAVPIFYNQSEGELLERVRQVNGILFAGGSTSLHNSSEYYQTGLTIYNAAVEANEKGEYFPLWGTCLGFEELGRLMSGSSDKVLSTGFDSENYPVPLESAEADLTRSRLFGTASPSLLHALTTKNITMNNHQAGITPTAFGELLAEQVALLTTNVDRTGAKYVSTMEHKTYPFYATQWHPEKNGFEWTEKEAIPHSNDAIDLMQHVANFFVREARKSEHGMPKDVQNRYLIYNFAPVFTGDPLGTSGFEQEYQWPDYRHAQDAPNPWANH